MDSRPTGQIEKVIKALIIFRQNMNSELYKEDVERMFGKELVKGLKLNVKSKVKRIEQNKISFAQSQVNDLLISDWVNFIGITGSVAAGIAKENDDIDIFVVIKNYRMWIYRLLLWLKSFRKKTIRRLGILGVNKVDDKSDVLCINIYAEERGLEFEVQDLFTVHELFHIVPIYNADYLNNILASNSWMRDKYFVNITSVIDNDLSTSRLGFIHILNFIAFCGQLITMTLHGFSLKKSIEAYKKGRVYYFPQNSREKYGINRICQVL